MHTLLLILLIRIDVHLKKTLGILEYENHLNAFDLINLMEIRSTKGDLIKMFKIMHNINQMGWRAIFKKSKVRLVVTTSKKLQDSKL